MVYKEFKVDSQLKDEISEGVVVVYFYTPTCGRCKMQKTIFNKLQDKDFKVVGVDATVHRKLALKYKVLSAPNCFIYKDKELVFNGGFLSRSALESILNQ